MLLAMLFMNDKIQTINYTLTNKENLEKKEEFMKISDRQIKAIRKELLMHHEMHLKCW